MAPELTIADQARRSGWSRELTRLHLFDRCPTFTAAEIERELDKIHGYERRSDQKSIEKGSAP